MLAHAVISNQGTLGNAVVPVSRSDILRFNPVTRADIIPHTGPSNR